MHTQLKLLSLACLALIAFSCFSALGSVLGQTNPADAKLAAANSAVNQAFKDVLAAEEAGANVTGLLNQLNVASGVLASAEISYRNGDFTSASTLADSVVPLAQQVSVNAKAAQVTASVDAQYAFYYTIVFSVAGSFVFILALLYVWLRIKRNHIKNLSELKPELAHSEA